MNEYQLKIGSHVGMSGKEMFLGSVKEAASYGANALMVYTGAPQNTRRKDVSELNIEAGQVYMKKHGLQDLIIHAPYIINLGNSVKPETFELAVDFLALELERTKAMGSNILVLHPGAHVGAGEDIGTSQIIKGLNEVLTSDTKVYVTLETMAGKGSEIGRNFEELGICFDTCHVHDSGLDIVNDFDGVIDKFDRIIGKEQIAVFHINDSKNPRGAGKDRHENIGFGHIGFDAIHRIVYHPDFESIPKILETPYIPSVKDPKKTYAPYKHEIAMLRIQDFNPKLREQVLAEQK